MGVRIVKEKHNKVENNREKTKKKKNGDRNSWK